MYNLHNMRKQSCVDVQKQILHKRETSRKERVKFSSLEDSFLGKDQVLRIYSRLDQVLIQL